MQTRSCSWVLSPAAIPSSSAHSHNLVTRQVSVILQASPLLSCVVSICHSLQPLPEKPWESAATSGEQLLPLLHRGRSHQFCSSRGLVVIIHPSPLFEARDARDTMFMREIAQLLTRLESCPSWPFQGPQLPFLTLWYHSTCLGSCAGSQLPKTSPVWKHARHWLQLTDCQQTSMPVWKKDKGDKQTWEPSWLAAAHPPPACCLPLAKQPCAAPSSSWHFGLCLQIRRSPKKHQETQRPPYSWRKAALVLHFTQWDPSSPPQPALHCTPVQRPTGCLWLTDVLCLSNPTLTKPLREHPKKLPKDLLLHAWRGSLFWQWAGSWQGEPVHTALG